MINNKPFYVFSTCLLVKGASRSIIYDLQRKSFDYIPNELHEILEEFNGRNVNDVFEHYGTENAEVLKEYFNFLNEKEYIYYSNLNERYFPKYRLEWESPFKISNIIFDVSASNMNLIDKLYQEIEALGVGGISFRFYSAKDYLDYFENIVNIFSISRCRSLEFFIPYSEAIDEKHLDDMTVINNRIFSYHIYGAPKDAIAALEGIKTPVFYHTELLDHNNDNVYIHKSNFIISREMFVESNNYNTYFNRKVFIDKCGKIKNAPTILKDYGNFEAIDLADVLKKPSFKKYWGIKKDMIEGCNICEYRHMCVDSRIPVNNGSNLWSVEGNCGYDPYNMAWIDEKK